MDLTNPIVLIGLVISITCLVFLIIIRLIPFLAKKGIDLSKYIQMADTVVDKTSEVIDIVEGVMPQGKILTVIQLVEKWARIGVDYAEQLYLTSTLDKNDRKETAKQQVYNVLDMLGIEVTVEIEKLIEGAIEAQVLALGHSTNNSDK